MRPGARDVKLRILITGEELAGLKEYTGDMAEALGLDRRIERYQGTRPIGLYRWDVECLMDVITFALPDVEQDPNHHRHRALRQLLARLRDEYRATYLLEDAQ